MSIKPNIIATLNSLYKEKGFPFSYYSKQSTLAQTNNIRNAINRFYDFYHLQKSVGKDWEKEYEEAKKNIRMIVDYHFLFNDTNKKISNAILYEKEVSELLASGKVGRASKTNLDKK